MTYCRYRLLARRAGIASVIARYFAVAGIAGVSAATASDDAIFAAGFEPCEVALTCTAPPGKSCIAGQLSDAATTLPLHADANVAQTCSGGATGGPCDLSLAVHDFLSYEQNPTGSTPLTVDETLIDGCGRFRLSGISGSSSGAVVLAAADGVGSSGHTPTATLHFLGPNQQVNGVNSFVTRSETVTGWSVSGAIADTSHGLILLTYTTDGVPTAGVAVFAPANPVGAVRYFTDADSQRQVATAMTTATGANGAALVADSPLQSFSGSIAGQTCTNINTASLPGVVVVGEITCSF